MSTTTIPNTQQSSPTTVAGPSFPSADPVKNVDPFNSQPSIYLYGFLATLVLIFLVSIGVAWKGYVTRRILRRRIDDAIARGVLIPGYDPENPNLPFWTTTTFNSRLRNAPAPPRPVMFEGWIDAPRPVGVGEKEWDIKPAAVTTLRPYDPASEESTPPNLHSNSLLNQLLDPLRQFWFVTPPSGSGANVNQLQGRPPRVSPARPWALTEAEEDEKRRKEAEEREKEGYLDGVDEVVASVLIAMPDRRRVAYAGAGTTRPNSSHQPAPVASGSRPTSSSAYLHAGTYGGITAAGVGGGGGDDEHKEDLPELMMGVVQVGVAIPEEEKKERERVGKEKMAAAAAISAGAEGKGKAVEGTSTSTPGERR